MKRKFAIPYSDNQLSKHFGKAEHFVFVITKNKSVVSSELIEAPVHEHGQLPHWISEHGTTHIITGGIGQKAMARFQELNIELIYGVEKEEPVILVKKFLDGNLKLGLNLCDH